MIATRGAVFQRGEIANANRDFEQRIQQSLGVDLNRALNRTLPPNDAFGGDVVRIAGNIRPGSERELMSERIPAEFLERAFSYAHLAFNGFLPALRSRLWRSLRGVNRGPDLQVKKSQSHFKDGIVLAADEAFRPHAEGFLTTLKFAIGLGIQHSKIPPLLIFHRGWAVRIQHVALVQHRLRNLLHP